VLFKAIAEAGRVWQGVTPAAVSGARQEGDVGAALPHVPDEAVRRWAAFAAG